MSAPAKPILAVTMGDPAGIGPEVVVKAWTEERVHDIARLVVVGHAEVLRRAVALLDREVVVADVRSAAELANESAGPAKIPCLKACGDEGLDVLPRQIDARAGEAAYRAVRLAATLALENQVDGIVTAPLSKAALHAAGHHYPGHTELLAEMCGVSDFAMMLYLPPPYPSLEWLGSSDSELPVASAAGGSPEARPQALSALLSRHGLGVVHVTLHQSLRSVFGDLTSEAIVAKCRLADGLMRRLGVKQPRIAVCALNPHAGEESLFGDEERTMIAPAVDAAREAGLNVSGPYPADTLMLRARDGEFDAVVAMYHDQGHIALKLLGMHNAVNITLGLPIVRTSVAHGTAFDKAWQGTARAEGMIAAIRTAAQLANSVPIAKHS